MPPHQTLCQRIMSDEDWTDYRAQALPFDLSGRMSSEYSCYFAALGDRIRREPNVTPNDIEDVGRNELIFDPEFLVDLNRQMRSFKARWLATDAEDSDWPDDLLIIGGSGCGDYYCISSSGVFQGIQIYEHEIGAFEYFADDFDTYYESIMVDIRKRHQPPE